MNIRKIFKGFTEKEVISILNQCGLNIDELPIAISAFAKWNKRTDTCDFYSLSLGKYHYMLNRIIPKIENTLKFKLFYK